MIGYTIARWIFKALLVCLTIIAIPLAIALIQVLVALPRQGFPDNLYSTILGWFFLPGASLTGTLSITGTLLFLLLLTGIITAIGEIHNGGLALKKYLRDVADKNSDLKPVGFSQQSALISVSVPLDEIFIHLYATTDRPRFDLPTEQLKHLEELRKRTDLTWEQREEEIQALRVIWYSQMGSGLLDAKNPQNIDVEDVIEHLTAIQPGAVILGAPGSGKSTTMRWLAYSMARASRLPLWRRILNTLLHLLNRLTHRHFTLGYTLPDEMAPAQLPILVRISEYAKVLGKSESEEVSFQEFFKQSHSKQPELAERLLHELEKGHCLLLLDGLDEVANDDLRRRVAENIATFVKLYTPENTKARRFNRFIITSRIVGYEGGTFSNYAHYTLQDLADEQIEQFLDHWCPAVERHQKTFTQGMKRLTPQQIAQANHEGQEQKERLWEALQQNPGIKRLAVNPLMLTILALIQRSGKTLPHRRIELYQIVTRTLLDNWNQEKGRRVFPPEEIPLAENMLSNLAYEMHSHDRLLTEAKVKEIAGSSMHDFFKQKPTEKKITTFIDTLRSSSGLFIETGQGFFSFMHRTIQEYYAAQYLLGLPPDRLEQSVRMYSHKALWHEPLLLLVAYKSTQSSREERQHASILIQTILETCDPYDEILQRNLLLAANCVVDCSAWSVQGDLQQRIANRIFDTYGDALETGRYTALQQDIERIALLWLQGQPGESNDAHPPFLDAWHHALCDASQPVRQEGAAHLLAALAPDLPNCPAPVLSILLPPLLQLADVVDMTNPPEHIRKQLPHTKAQPATLQVTEYAIVTLLLLDEAGPAGWLHKEWIQWHKEKPELLERLTQHALELGYLLTPAAFPANSSDLNWNIQYELGKEWQKRARQNPGEFQSQLLLQASTTARFPQAWLFKKLLGGEEKPAAQNVPWQVTWDKILREEMARGKSATYQSCLDLRSLLAKGDKQQLQDITTELQTALSRCDQKQVLALNVMINDYLRDLHDSFHLLDIRYILAIRTILDIRKVLYISDLRYMRNILNARYLLFIFYIRNTLSVTRMLDILSVTHMLDMLDMLDEKLIISDMCSSLKQKSAHHSAILLCIYSIICDNAIILSDQKDEITRCIQEFTRSTQQQPSSTLEQRLLIKSINKVLATNTTNAQTPITQPLATRTADERAKQILALQQQAALNKNEIEELLTACTDTREMTKETWQEVADEEMILDRQNPGSVGNLAWKQISQQWKMDTNTREVVIQKLDDSNAIICAAAALILQQSKHFTERERKMAAQKIMTILRDEDLSRRPLDPPVSYFSNIWRLDDVLFETLKILAE